MSSKISLTKPFILYMYGFPGAGKTAFSRQFGEELGVIHLQEDKILHDLLGVAKNPKTSVIARKIMDFMTEEYLKAGIPVVYDAGVLRASQRRSLREMAHRNKAATILVWFQIDPETTFERTQKRDRRKADDKYATEYTEDEYRTVLSHMQNPKMEDYVVVSGKHTFGSQRSSVFKKMLDMGLISSGDAVSGMTKPGLTNLVPKSKIQMRGDIIQRNISIR